jgi:hypothetical protein
MNLHSHKIGISSIHIPVDAMPVKSHSSFDLHLIEDEKYVNEAGNAGGYFHTTTTSTATKIVRIIQIG